MELKERLFVDSADNGLIVEQADEDGVHICESTGDMRVYVYYSEIDKLIEVLQEIQRIHNNII